MKSKKFDNYKRKSGLKTLLRFLVMSPFCMIFSGMAGNPLLAAETTTTTNADGQSSIDSASSVTEPAAQSTETTTTDTTTESNVEGTPTPVDSNVLRELGLEKFKDVTALANSYKSIEQLHSRTANEKSQIQAERDNLLQQIETLKQQAIQPAVNTISTDKSGLTPEQVEEENMKLAEMAMNDPLAFIEKIKNEAKEQSKREIESIKQQVEPFIQKNQKAEQQEKINTRASEFTNAVDPAGNLMHPEVSRPEVREVMVEAFTKFPGLSDSEEGFETAYKYAIGELNIAGNSTAVEPNKLLEDENFIKQAATNPKIMELATKAYLENIKSGNPPPVMGSAISGTPSAMEANKPKTIADGGKAFLKSIGL